METIAQLLLLSLIVAAVVYFVTFALDPRPVWAQPVLALLVAAIIVLFAPAGMPLSLKLPFTAPWANVCHVLILAIAGLLIAGLLIARRVQQDA